MPEDPPNDVVVHGPNAVWSKQELGDDFDVTTLSVIGELDPTGANGVLEEVLKLFGDSLEPVLTKLERLRAASAGEGIMFEAHKLKSAAAQLGALRLSAACADVLKHFEADPGALKAAHLAPELERLVDVMMAETIRVQRKLRRLLGA